MCNKLFHSISHSIFKTPGVKVIGTTVLLLLLLSVGVFAQEEDSKPRTIVLTDGEADDMDSFIRFLLYTNEFDVEGFIYSASQWHYAGDGLGTTFTSAMPMTADWYGERTSLRWTGTAWMQEFIDKYAEIYDNLILHDPDYPTPDYLQSIIHVGNINFEGDMAEETDGSQWIEQVLLDDEGGPVYFQVWGGTNTLSRALQSIEEEYKDTPEWDDIYAKVSAKAVIYTILDQDATYQNYIAPNWPDIKVLYNSAQFWSFAYMWTTAVPAELQTYLNGDWYSENIKFNHGSLLSSYYLWGDGQRVTGDPDYTSWNLENAIASERMQYDFISEGDSPSFFYLLDLGLRNDEDASYGGWGGRLVQSETSPNRWEDGEQVTDFNPYTNEADTTYPQVRWIDAIQNDFAARADWAVMSYDEANHAPVVTLNSDLNVTAGVGVTVELSASATDSDGDDVSYQWWQYTDVDTYAGTVEIATPDGQEASFVVPDDAQVGDTIHVIVAASDSGSPTLTRYQRVIVTVGE